MAPLSLQAKRMQAARTALVLDQPFFGVLALQLRLQEDASCGTAWIDGRTLGYSPTFVAGLSDAALQGLICHEVMHAACGHPWRRGARDHKRFNVACDYAINPLIVAAGMQLPADVLLDPQYSGHYAEWIYDRLPAPQPEPEPEPGDQGEPGDGDASQPDGDAPGSPDSNVSDDAPDAPQAPGDGVRDAPTGADAPTESEWAETVAQATKIAEAAGKMPGALGRGMGAATAPKSDWRSALRRFVQETCSADYTWTRPNVRYLSGGLYLPALHSQQCGRIVVALDTSGSVDDVLLAQFGAELQAIADDVQPASIDVIYCDAAVNKVETYERGDAIKLSPCGGGGTAFGPVFDHVDASGDAAPAVLVYLTDLYGSFPETAPDYPVLWAVTSGASHAPFGDILPIE